ncbi:MAG: permease [Sedimentisphaerales bacterium]|nr:permease [Sedimentisphaerales bacterium]
MNQLTKHKKLLLIIGIFLACFYLPLGRARFDNAVMEALYLLKWYAREHVILCLIPAFFIAGAVSVFIGSQSVMKYLGPKANKLLAYAVASVSGSILAVCSCTILPLFAGIYRMGAGLGPATAFLYSGPAINILAIILTARVLGLQIGIARAVGAILFSIIIGLIMHFLFERHPGTNTAPQPQIPTDTHHRSLAQNALYFASLIGILVFANWAPPAEQTGLWFKIYSAKWFIAAAFAAALALILIIWFHIRPWKIILAAAPVIALSIAIPQYPIIPFITAVALLSIILATEKPDSENAQWLNSTWEFAQLILPLLMLGVIFAGLLLGRPGHQGLIPSQWIARAVGGNSITANLFASVAGAFMYFATLTEIPILQGLMGAGMGKGPALALLLAGPALSLPNMLVIRTVLGTTKTITFVLLVIIMATISGIIFGAMCP